MDKNLTLNYSERQKIISIIREICHIENLDLDDKTVLATLPDLDSIGVFQLLGKIEIELFVNLGFESIDKVKTVEDIYTVVANAREEKL